MWCGSVVLIVIYLNLNLYIRGYYGDDNIVQWHVEEQFYSQQKFHLREPKVILKDDKPLQVVLHNYDKHTKTGSCWNILNETALFPTQIKCRENGKRYDLIIKVPKVTDEMSTQWQCSVWKYWLANNRYQDFTFKIHIRRNDRVNVYVNRQQLIYNVTDLSEMEFDGVADYWYMESQTIDVTCERNRHVNDEGNLRVKYYTAAGTMLFETDLFESGYPINLQKTMNVENDNDIIYCTYISKANIEYTYKTILKFKENISNNPLKITVNGLKLVPSQTNRTTAQYQYRFYDKQVLNIVCEMDKDLLGNLTLGSNSPGLIPEDFTATQHFPWQSTKTINMKREFDGNSLRCGTTGLKTQFSAEIFLLLESTESRYFRNGPMRRKSEFDDGRQEISRRTSKKHPVILGLTESDVIQKYSKNLTTRVIDYLYTEDQKLNLTCVSRTKGIYPWIIKNNSVESYVPGSGVYKNHSLNQKHDRTSIICNTGQGKAIINLYLKAEIASSDFSIEDDMINTNINEVNGDGDDRASETDNIKDSDLTTGLLINDPNLFYYIAAAVAGLILILTIVLVIAFKLNKSKKSVPTPIFTNQTAVEKDAVDKLYSNLPLYADLDLPSMPDDDGRPVNEESPYAEVINPNTVIYAQVDVPGGNHYPQATNTLYAQVNKVPNVY